ncbi:PTS sugar transporter subunit IIA [Bythopirellula polymerisocia]|uniref:PTS system fructose-specific EIIABC component n=1 Tax=Bythopirellula polymerisocia TaxID=2528003 RepID=A0A5C6CQV4_9BACT|nr:PTS sugar transporter subunit IIA [Bythopirellula polymerisocia]TWU25851.1 PTS system fructose-specific EIIABC component [Bythopirellula polymerisocia]
MKRLLEACDQGLLLLDVSAGSLDSAIQQMVGLLVHKGLLAATDAGEMLSALRDRERLSASAIGHAVAVPHSYLSCLEKPSIVIARLKHAINAGAPDGLPTRFIFLLVGPTGATAEHLDSLASVARLMADGEFRYLAQIAKTPAEFRAAVASRSQEEIAPVPPKSDEGLQYSGRLLGGLMADIRRRLPHYASDFLDGLNRKCVASTLFLFFACMAPTIIFGGLMGKLTDGHIGAVELIVATAFCGVVYALFAGQPLALIGGTGPMLAFTAILYAYCDSHEIPFLPTYTWVGIWTAIFVVIMAITDASCLMRFFTRFTDEIFAALISLIFISEAVKNLIAIYHRVPEAASQGYGIANLSLLLALGTFYVAMSLSRFRHSHLLLPAVREFLADFGPTIAIASMAAIAYFARDVTPLEPLPAPTAFGTTSGRPWLVPFLDAPQWLIWATIAPGLLCSVLVFLDQNITVRLVNSPDNRLKKGSSYHLDLGIVGVLIAICSIFGLPWLVAATVRSLNHLRSLATTEEVIDKSGVAHTQILHVRENRITGISIHILIGMSLLLLPALHYIPLAVLFGLFLYMGIVSMRGNQFFQRIGLWLTDPALYPSTHYVRRVSKKTLHLFTLIQFACLVVLLIVKSSVFGIFFPLFIALLVPFRYALGYLFSEKDLAVLDAEENPIEEEETWS